MRICLMCDMHLPSDTRALQYDVLSWAVKELSESKPDCIIFAGDVTCDGNQTVYDSFIKDMTELEIPFLYIPGNSDLRSADTRNVIKEQASPCENRIKETTIYAINDCEKKISPEQISLLEEADDDSIVFMHHPPKNNESLLEWRKRHPKTMTFYAHSHRFVEDGSLIGLPAMDPDKTIGEEPCIVYYDTETKQLCKSHYPAHMPEEMPEYFGISCYNPLEQIDFAIERGLKYIELRRNCTSVEEKELVARVEAWRASGGKGLAVHLPDVGYSDGKVIFKDKYDEVFRIVSLLKADRITQHVPRVGVKTVESDPRVLEEICDALAARFNTISHSVTIGVENMHMTAKESPDGNRRFGYIPEECIKFMKTLGERCRHKVGVNFDIGHARNNPPYNETYQIGTWLLTLGEYIVGYHLHQVTEENGHYENHTAFTEIYGRLISLASFFKSWEQGRINHVQIIFEMRQEDAYEKTLDTFREYCNSLEKQ